MECKSLLCLNLTYRCHFHLNNSPFTNLVWLDISANATNRNKLESTSTAAEERSSLWVTLWFLFCFWLNWIFFFFSFFSWMFSRSLFSLLRIYQTSSKCFTKLTPQTIANTTAFLTFVSLLQEFLASLWLQRLLGKLRCVLQTLRGHDLVRSGWGLVGRCQRRDVRCFCQFYWKLVNLFVIALLLYYYYYFFYLRRHLGTKD